jgi:two-component system, NtrC family, sensor histidine kinase HydH
MNQPLPGLRRPKVTAAWVYILGALAIVALLGSIIAIYDVQRAVRDLRDEELKRLRLNAERSAGQIESELQDEVASDKLETIRNAVWLRRYWTRNLTQQPGRIYAAVTDRQGVLVAHTRREEEGRKIALPPHGDGGSLTETALVETTDETLTAGLRALDMRVPIVVNQAALGIYHTGMDAVWLDSQLAQERRSRTTFWSLLVGGTSALLLVSSIAVARVTRQTARFEHELEAANARRVSEMHELVLGVAHEIRNPLNAIRLNLHTIGQVFSDQAALGDEEIATMLVEMEGEIERLEALMREMLGFARTGNAYVGPVDLADEIQRTLTFLRSNFDRQRVSVELRLQGGPCMVAIDATRFRQVLLNLLKNALEAVGEGGAIDVEARLARNQVEVVVADNGAGIPVNDRERVFVPFFSTKANGTGLGLAVARKFIEEAGGRIICEDRSARRGCQVRVVLPAASAAVLEGAT